ncbi:hypothetical protein AB0G73_22220 [Streptomyces sp. NPDC020719]|uniref:hypothetical protein n=1 Tax=Streptomyces sp. NPDC020719 TaxID=3154896 RepID=UPI0033F73F53
MLALPGRRYAVESAPLSATVRSQLRPFLENTELAYSTDGFGAACWTLPSRIELEVEVEVSATRHAVTPMVVRLRADT